MHGQKVLDMLTKLLRTVPIVLVLEIPSFRRRYNPSPLLGLLRTCGSLSLSILSLSSSLCLYSTSIQQIDHLLHLEGGSSSFGRKEGGGASGQSR